MIVSSAVAMTANGRCVQLRFIQSMLMFLLFCFINTGTLSAGTKNDARKAFDQAYEYYSSGKYYEALEMYEKASHLDPGFC
jgi:tetratricopeptide (TPR) repeat protein